MNKPLFKDSQGQVYTLKNVMKALKDVGAYNAKILYIHTDIGFGRPLVKRKEFVAKLYDVLNLLGVETLIFPTYTFSFSNNEIYDVKNSKSSMGMLNEFARKQENSFRTKDPLMSVCVIGKVPKEFYNLSKYSCGKGSAFDIMTKSDEYKFLFFGAQPTQCFTFMHYVEDLYGVPYRYNKKLTGKIIHEDGKEEEDTYTICATYDTVIPGVGMDFQDFLEKEGTISKVPLGEKEIILIKGKSSFEAIKKCLENDINILLARPYDTYELKKVYTFGNVNSVK